MISHKKRKRIQTTDSDHCFYKYPNQAKNLVPKRANMLWVADMTYIQLGSVFIYLSVIMDAYSRKIVGWHLDKTMQAQGWVYALEMALCARGKAGGALIHHSDRGVQYCSWKYADLLRNNGITIA